MEMSVIERDEVPQLVALFLEVFNAPPWNDGWSVEAARERLCAFADHPRFTGLRAMRGDRIVGFALGWAERWVSEWHFHLYEMCVAPDCQGSGVGRALLGALESHVGERGMPIVFLETRSDAGARTFYEKLGYKVADIVAMGKARG